MSNTTNGTPAAPVRRTAAEEEQDRDEVIKNLTSGAYLDWPNEAGVSFPFPLPQALYAAS